MQCSCFFWSTGRSCSLSVQSICCLLEPANPVFTIQHLFKHSLLIFRDNGEDKGGERGLQREEWLPKDGMEKQKGGKIQFDQKEREPIAAKLMGEPLHERVVYTLSPRLLLTVEDTARGPDVDRRGGDRL